MAEEAEGMLAPPRSQCSVPSARVESSNGGRAEGQSLAADSLSSLAIRSVAHLGMRRGRERRDAALEPAAHDVHRASASRLTAGGCAPAHKRDDEGEPGEPS